MKPDMNQQLIGPVCVRSETANRSKLKTARPKWLEKNAKPDTNNIFRTIAQQPIMDKCILKIDCIQQRRGVPVKRVFR